MWMDTDGNPLPYDQQIKLLMEALNVSENEANMILNIEIGNLPHGDVVTLDDDDNVISSEPQYTDNN